MKTIPDSYRHATCWKARRQSPFPNESAPIHNIKHSLFTGAGIRKLHAPENSIRSAAAVWPPTRLNGQLPVPGRSHSDLPRATGVGGPTNPRRHSEQASPTAEHAVTPDRSEVGSARGTERRRPAGQPSRYRRDRLVVDVIESSQPAPCRRHNRTATVTVVTVFTASAPPPPVRTSSAKGDQQKYPSHDQVAL